MSRRILDSLKGPDAAAIAGATLRFVAWSTGYDAATTPRTADAVTTTGDAGEIDITLQNGVYQVFLTESGGEAVYLGKATITDGSDTTLAAVLGASGTVTSEVLALIEAITNDLETLIHQGI